MATRLGLQAKLFDMGMAALKEDWTVSSSIKPLSKEEIDFLQSHTIQDITPSFFTGRNDSVKDFIVQVLTSLSVELARAYLEVQHPPHGIADRQLATLNPKDLHEQKNIETHATTDVYTSAEKDHTKPSDPDSSKQTHDLTQTHSKDPSLHHMTDLAAKKTSSLVFKSSMKLLQSELISSNREAAINKAVEILGSGSSASDAKAAYVATIDAGRDFATKLTTSISAGVKTGIFLNKMSEQGFFPATFDLAKDSIIKVIAETSTEAVFKVMSCTAPAGLAANVALIVTDLFKPTELAPDWKDQPPPPGWVLDILEQVPPPSGIPDLFLPIPAIREVK